MFCLWNNHKKKMCVCVFSTNTFFYIYLCGGGILVEVRGQPAGAGALLPPCGFWGLNSCIRHLQQQAPLLSELRCWSLQTHFFNKMFFNLQMPNSRTWKEDQPNAEAGDLCCRVFRIVSLSLGKYVFPCQLKCHH